MFGNGNRTSLYKCTQAGIKSGLVETGDQAKKAGLTGVESRMGQEIQHILLVRVSCSAYPRFAVSPVRLFTSCQIPSLNRLTYPIAG
jgi:hypothetical protein